MIPENQTRPPGFGPDVLKQVEAPFNLEAAVWTLKGGRKGGLGNGGGATVPATRLRAVAGKLSQPGGGAAPESAAACWTRRKVQTAKAQSSDENTTCRRPPPPPPPR